MRRPTAAHRFAVVAASLALAWTEGAVRAEEPPAAEAAPAPTPSAAPAAPAKLLEFRYDDWTVAFEGEWRLRLTYLTGFQPVDPELIPGAEQPDSDWLEHRLRLEPSVAWRPDGGPVRSVRLVAQADFAEGVIGGDTPPVRAIRDDELDAADLDYLWGEAVADGFVVRLGRQGSKWALGLVADDGIGEAPWGDKRYGDRVDRVGVRYGGLPGDAEHPWAVAAAVDRPVEDDLTRHGWQDHAWNYVVGVSYGDGVLEGGLYDAFRLQRNERDTNTRVNLTDGFVRWRADEWKVEAEAVIAVGNTELVATPASPSQATVLEHGATVSAGYATESLDALLDAGYASGDGNPFDDEVTNFTFDPDFNVGLVMFEEYLAGLTSASAYNLGDPLLVGSPTPGAYLVETRGGVTNAVYLNPRLTWREARDRGWEVKLGVLWAHALEDVVDPFASFDAGGSPRNYLGGPVGDHDLGFELDGGLGYRILADEIHVMVGVESGGYWPGGAFRDPSGAKPDAIALVQGRLSARW